MRIKELAKLSGGSVSDLFNLPLSVLDPNPENIRLDTEELRAHVRGIADSIRETGFLRSRALTVRLVGERAIVVDGNLRLMACRIAVENGAELLTVPCVPEAPGTTPAERLANMVVSNSGLAHSPLEKVAAIKLMMSYGWTDTNIAQRFGVSRQTISNMLDLAGSTPDVLKAITDGTVKPTLARQLTREKGDGAGAAIAEVIKTTGKKHLTAKDFVTVKPAPAKPPMGLTGAVREMLRIWDAGELDADFDQVIEILRGMVA